ncbi:clock interacting protein circadian [Anticarsia gemmatalis]|uniref:clock interacting protein circadian n=1 Tax=Anticarsia gemmatalis TaxID=129554 RepID=UPI003F7723BB
MCEKRTRKIKKGSHLTRLREARRLQRLQRLTSPSTSDESNTVPCPPTVNQSAQNQVILELAWKTVALMHKNRLIQQKIIALKKETSEFVAAVMNDPENKRRYVEYTRIYGPPETDVLLHPRKIEPNV